MSRKTTQSEALVHLFFNPDSFADQRSKEIRDRKGRLIKITAYVNPGICQGCGTCQATCPSKSVELYGFTDEQIYAAINALAL